MKVTNSQKLPIKLMAKKQIKQRYFDKVYRDAKVVECACGCGQVIKSKDKYGRDKKFISGHNNRKYDDPTQHKREWNYRNRKKRLMAKSERGHRLKVKLIKIMGGACLNCSIEYDGKNACIFQFHHQNSKTKKYSITVRTLVHYAWEKMLKESKKCDLFCANCHFIKHSEEY